MSHSKGLFKWVKNYWILVSAVLFFTILIPISYSYVPQFIRYIFDNILGFNPDLDQRINLPSSLLNFFNKFNNPKELLIVVGATLLLFQAIRGVFMFFNGYFKGKLAENIAYDIRVETYSHIQDLSYSYHNNIDTGDLIQRCTSDVDTIKSFLSAQLPQLFNILGTVAAGAIQMAIMNVKIMLVTLAVIPITVTMSIIYFNFVKKKFEELEEKESEITTIVQENINGVRVVKAFASEGQEINKFKKSNAEFRDLDQEFGKMMALYWGISDLLTLLQYLITLTVAIFLARKGEITGGDYVAYAMYIGMLVWPIRGLGRIIGDFGKAIVASERIDEILEIPTEYIDDGILRPDITGDIIFDNIHFKFEDSDKYLLKGVSFSIASGETVAIVGKTGSGKSTIANLLVRMLEYNEGSILIDGVELKEIEKRWIRQNVGIILQSPFLYTRTIYDNIAIGSNKLNSEDIFKAAMIADIHEDIQKFERGYDTLVGEKGVTLSGGQKQRVAIARMLVLNKPIIVFDDSLSAVDTKTDLSIRNALKANSKGLTSIIITHRISTAREADKIIVLEDGIVSAIGTHEELSKKPGLYQNLWNIQGALEEEFMELVLKE